MGGGGGVEWVGGGVCGKKKDLKRFKQLYKIEKPNQASQYPQIQSPSKYWRPEEVKGRFHANHTPLQKIYARRRNVCVLIPYTCTARLVLVQFLELSSSSYRGLIICIV